MSSSLIAKATVEELVGHRNRAIESYRTTLENLTKAQDWHKKAAPLRNYIKSVHLGHHYRSVSLEEIIAHVDRDAWRSALEQTDILRLMDKEAREAFEKDLEASPPPFTVDNVTATVFRLVGEADSIFRRGLVNAFSKLSRRYKSNDAFAVKERTIIENAIHVITPAPKLLFGHVRREDELSDIDRVVHVLDGRAYHRYGTKSLLSELRSASDRGPGSFETHFWRGRLYANGNLHLWCKDRDILRGINRLIAEHFGAAIARDGK